MVRALQARGHTVAMTGDGVNDVLALKLADLGIAMGSGAPATKAVAELVLLDGRFAALPGVVAEGRRVTANIERVANLFITKTVWAALLAVAVGAALLPYPFLPRHLTIIDTLAIGIPSFFLALAPNTRRYQPGFTGRVLRFAIPAGIIVAVSALAAYALARAAGLPPVQQGTAATTVTLALSLTVLVLLAVPLTWRRDRPGRRGTGRVRAAVPGPGGTGLLRAGTAPRRAGRHAADRRARGRRAGGLLAAVPPLAGRGHSGTSSVHHVGPVAQRRVRFPDRGRALRDRQALPGQLGLGDLQRRRLQQPAVSRNDVARLYRDDIAGDQLLGGDLRLLAVAPHPGRDDHHLLERGDGGFGLALLLQAENRVAQRQQEQQDAGSQLPEGVEAEDAGRDNGTGHRGRTARAGPSALGPARARDEDR